MRNKGVAGPGAERYVRLGQTSEGTAESQRWWTLLPRICFAGSILVWTGYLLYFQFEGLARVAARHPPEHPLSENSYIVGVIAYKDALIDLRLSILVVVFALVVLTIGFRRRRSEDAGGN